MSNELRGSVSLVTGGASGIGRAVAIAFASAGAKVVVADLDGRAAEATVKDIVGAGGAATSVEADVSRSADAQRLVAMTLQAYGRLDAAVNNAGLDGTRAFTADCTEENWDRTVAVNLKGVWLCMKSEIPALLKQGRGAIVNVASVGGLVGVRGLPAYTASKHGVVGLTKAAALEYAKSGIRINAVCPALVDTPMVECQLGANPELKAQALALQPVGRLGTPEEVAQAVLWLCSDAAAFVTGHAMAVDGGWTAQ